MGLMKNANKAGMTMIGDCLAEGGKLETHGPNKVCVKSGPINDRWIKRGAQHGGGGNSGHPAQHKGAKNCTSQAAAHGTALQGAPCTEKAKKN